MTQKRRKPSAAKTPAQLEQPAVEVAMPVEEELVADRGPLFWRIVGGAAVAVVAVIGLAVYQQMQAQVSAQRRELSTLNNELRKDLGKLGGSYSEMLKKEDHNAKVAKVWETLKELRADRSDLTILKERCNQLAEAHKAGEEERRALAAEVRRLRESKTADEERAALAYEIRALRERLAQMESSKPRTRISHEEPSAEQEER